MGLVEPIIAHISTAPVFYSALVVIVSVVALKLKGSSSSSEPNPFHSDTRKKRKPPNCNKDETDKVLKQGFAQKKIPENLDAIVIGSGIGGLTTAAIMAKNGKKVLVLEQHDQAGGCCHTFTEKGFEFDVGIHYVGKIHKAGFTRTLLDQISYGQIQWQALDENYDTIVLGKGEDQLKVPLRAGDKFKQSLYDAFPEDKPAIDKFISDLAAIEYSMLGLVLLKTLPVWLAQLLLKTGILNIFTSYTKYSTLTTQDYIDSITDNIRLRTVFAYAYGDYGTKPNDSCVMMNASLFNHFKKGAGYPVGGASQIAYNIIPVIEAAGGKVLVRAKVTDIITENGRAVGVRVSKGQQEAVDIYAPIVVSNAGILNTKNMLPKEVFSKSPVAELISSGKVHNGAGALSLFVGLKGSAEELDLKAQNIWAFTEFDLNAGFDKMVRKTIDIENVGDVNIMFLSFPSAKDPSWKPRNPDKTTLTAITVVNYEWFEPWVDEQVKHRGASYEQLKDAIGQQMWTQIVEMFPQLEGKIEYFEVGSPLTNNYYIGSNRGEMYGLDHDASRFDGDVALKLRPNIGIPGLFISGQDVMTCGFTGAIYGGLLCAGTILNRDVYSDCDKLHKQLLKDGTALDRFSVD